MLHGEGEAYVAMGTVVHRVAHMSRWTAHYVMIHYRLRCAQGWLGHGT
jgi:hypothetical protein